MATPVYFDIGDFVWLDRNANGVQDSGEQGVKDVKVYLCDKNGNPILNRQDQPTFTTTDGNGFYKFTQVDNDEYTLRFVDPSNKYMFTQAHVGTDDEKDSDADQKTGLSQVFTINYNTDLSVDAGLYLKSEGVTLGDFVWDDVDQDGVQDAGESGIKDVVVKLYYENGTYLMQTTTDVNGKYQFSELLPTKYKLQFTNLPTNYVFAPKDQGTDDAKDSDVNRDSGYTDVFDLSGYKGSSNLTLDAGMYQPSAIGDWLWIDSNGNGRQDDGEAGMGGVKVTLSSGSRTWETTTSTVAGSVGKYLFDDLPAGNYNIKFDLPSGHIFTSQNLIADDSKDSDVNQSGQASITLNKGQRTLDLDAGIYPRAKGLASALGNYVWNDTNGDGIQNEAASAGRGNVVVTLYNGSKTRLMDTTTDAQGYYDFDELVPGDYYVQFATQNGLAFSPKDQGGNDEQDSDPASDGWTAKYTLLPGQTNYSIDAGYFIPATLGDKVWHDIDGDGVQDSGEAGIANAQVSLFNKTSGQQVGTTLLTGADGSYLFENIAPGSYYVQFARPTTGVFATGSVFSPLDQGGNDALDSDANVNTGRTADIVLNSGDNIRTVDAGLYKYASLGDRVWHDLDADGIQDAGELGIVGAKVYLLKDGVATGQMDTTAAGGVYSFTNLAPGNYSVRFDLPSAVGYHRFSPNNNATTTDALDSDANVSSGLSASYVLTSGMNNTSVDAGMYKLVNLGDKVWHDLNANGIQETGEAGINGVAVYLLKDGVETGAVSTTVNGGLYAFNNLVPGSYSVRFAMPNTVGYKYFSPANNSSTTDALDSDANTSTGRTNSVELTSGNHNLNVDAGMYTTASLGDKVWHDRNGNGLQDVGEEGIAGARVTLFKNGVEVTNSTITTDARGNYRFDNLVPANYSVKFQAPATGVFANAKFTHANKVANDALDSDANASTGMTGNYLLQSGESELSVDAGMFLPVSIGDRVWRDVDGDGMQKLTTTGTYHTDEPGIANVTLALWAADGTRAKDINGNTLATVETNSQGIYQFENVMPGQNYEIQLVSYPTSLRASKLDAGNDNLDSDFKANGWTEDFDALSGTTITNIDAGLVVSQQIAGSVWHDVIQSGSKYLNGVWDGSELGLAGASVTLQIKGSDGKYTTVTDGVRSTDQNGDYNFGTRPVGDYRLLFAKDSYLLTYQDKGGDDSKDSDPDQKTGMVNFKLYAGIDVDMDAGMALKARIGDVLWNDHYNSKNEEVAVDGLQGGARGSVGSAVEIYLQGSPDGVLKTLGVANGAMNGRYGFDVLPGEYRLYAKTIAGCYATKANAGKTKW